MPPDIFSVWTAAVIKVKDRARTDKEAVAVLATQVVENKATFRRSDTETQLKEL